MKYTAYPAPPFPTQDTANNPATDCEGLVKYTAYPAPPFANNPAMDCAFHQWS